MTTISDRLRKLAEELRKQGGAPPAPPITPNPVASRAQGTLGSLDMGKKDSESNRFVPKLPKLPEFGIGGQK